MRSSVFFGHTNLHSFSDAARPQNSDQKVTLELHLVNLANLGFTIARHLEKLLGELDSLRLGCRTDQSKPTHHLFRLGKRAIHHVELPVGHANPRTQSAWQAP